MTQNLMDIAESKEVSRMECAKKCHGNEACIGFEYNPTTNVCFLSNASWRQMVPTEFADWWVCEKKDGTT